MKFEEENTENFLLKDTNKCVFYLENYDEYFRIKQWSSCVVEGFRLKFGVQLRMSIGGLTKIFFRKFSF